jgi:hypothetical protein
MSTKFIDSLDLVTRNQVISEVTEILEAQKKEQDNKLKGVSEEVAEFIKEKQAAAVSNKFVGKKL